jgi:uncharacterized protein with von Willebrand factor type A (vWA) domain
MRYDADGETERDYLACVSIQIASYSLSYSRFIADKGLTIYRGSSITKKKTFTREMERDTIKSNETAATKEATAAVIDTSSSAHATSKTASPIVIKIEAPREATKQVDEKVLKMHLKQKCSEASDEKSAKSRLCRLLPVLLFLVTFATVLSLLILYMDPSSEYTLPK